MTAFTDLTTDQQNQISTFMQLFRQRVGALASNLAALDQLQQIWNATVSAEITGLDADTLIPDNPVGNGSVLLSREDMLTLMTAVGTVLTNFNQAANRANFIKVAGMIGIW